MTLELAQSLIRLPSVTPEDAGCQRIISERLAASGFECVQRRFEDVDNLWAVHGRDAPLLMFLGHTDVVPPGPESKWDSNPFTPTLRDGYLYGRGAADMKGSVAAMVTAMERFLAAGPQHAGTLALLLTSDEEGAAVNGTRKMLDNLLQQDTHIDWCVVGEPSSQTELADTIKNGRRGSLTGTLTIIGVQGHVAYPEMARNPIHLLAPALAELTATRWDEGNAHYPPTSFQISNINAGTGADNVIPDHVRILFNFRYSTCVTADELGQRLGRILDRYKLHYDIQWRDPSLPFLTAGGRLLQTITEVIAEKTGSKPEVSTAGGTSDGRFAAAAGAEVVELGPVNTTIHKINECVAVRDLEALSDIYETIMRRLLG